MVTDARQGAQRRRDNFFRGTMRDASALTDDHDQSLVPPRVERAPNGALEIDALRIIRTNLEAKALSQGGMKLTEAQLGIMMHAAQHTLRGMSDDQLKAVASSGSALEAIVATSFNSVPSADAAQRAAQQTAAATASGTARDSQQQLARLEMMRGGISSAERSREMGIERGSTEERAQIASASSLAMKLGMPWAVNNPGLLRLGPSAIQALHDVQIDRRTYNHFTADAGFTARDAVAAARFARRNNLDGKQTLNTVADSVQTFGGHDPSEQARWRGLFNDRMAETDRQGRPLSPEQVEQNRQRLDAALTEHQGKYPEHAAQVAKAREATRTLSTALTTAAQSEARASGTEARTATAVGELDAIAATAPAAAVKPQPGAQPPAAPNAKPATAAQSKPATQSAAITPPRAAPPKPN